MSPFNSFEEYRRINPIMERDSTDTTYKYALLRGTIEICEEYQHLGSHEEGQVWFPLGLMIEKWIPFYYPIIADTRFIPQKGGESAEGSNHIRLSFRPLLTELVRYYQSAGGRLSHFYHDYVNGVIPNEISYKFLSLCRRLRTTITQMPMNHLGYSWSKKPYSIFTSPTNVVPLNVSENSSMNRIESFLPFLPPILGFFPKASSRRSLRQDKTLPQTPVQRARRGGNPLILQPFL